MLHSLRIVSCALVSILAFFSNTSAAQDTPPLPEKEKSSFSKEKLSNLYSPHFLRLLQIIYGTENVISQGGLESIDDMFSGINLEGKKMLDVGCGFGGEALYLAQQYHVNIIGVEKEPYMIVQAEKIKAKQTSPLKGQVSFQIMVVATTLKEFPDNTFDIVYCKEVMYHVPINRKQELINEMYRVLKPGGQLVTAEWICSTSPGQRLKNAVKVEGFCHFISAKEYLAMLNQANFRIITFRDVTKEHIAYSLKDIQRLKKAENQIRQELGNETYDPALISMNLWLDAMIDPPELMAGVFVGTK